MKIEWRKCGLIYCPAGEGYFKSHATRPIPYRMDEGTLRLFFSSRDADGRMLPTYIDVDVGNPSKILSICDRPLIDLGSPGTFDDFRGDSRLYPHDGRSGPFLLYRLEKAACRQL